MRWRLRSRRWRLVVGAAMIASCDDLAAQMPASTYARAERFLGWNIDSLVWRDSITPSWIDPWRFWYRDRGPSGDRFVLIDARDGSEQPLFDHESLAAALSAATSMAVSAAALPIQRIEQYTGSALRFSTRDRRRWECYFAKRRCSPAPPIPASVANEVRSPDGRLATFIRRHDLWVREVDSGTETRLTYDGERHYGYATDSEGWRRSERPVVIWSPDSRRIATYRLDERNVGEMYLTNTVVGRPRLLAYPYAIPGDTIIPRMERYIFDVPSRTAVRIDFPPDVQRNTTCCGTFRDSAWTDVQWGAESAKLYFASVSRDYRHVALVEADATSGRTRVLLREDAPTFFESNVRYNRQHNWRVIADGREVLWQSERDGWAHLYLYDGTTGRLKNRVTAGAWVVGDVLAVDPTTRTVLFTALGRERGRNPYFRALYRARLDGSRVEMVTPEDANHESYLSPTGEYVVDTYSRTGVPPVTVLRDARGREIRTLHRADISRLIAVGWKPPEAFTVMARDGATPVYGLLFRPSTLIPGKSYPVVVYIYPGPQIGSVTTHGFATSYRGNPQALAELGFVVVQVDGLGTPLRSKAFHDAGYGRMGDAGIEDQIAALRQLGARYPELDLKRVGIYGHSGGGFAAASAILRFPQFFSVAVSSAGNHDNRGYTAYWGERYQGLFVRDSAGGDNYRAQANSEIAERFSGKLLLMYGTMDDNVHPNMTLQLVDALIRSNSDVDVLPLPNRNHRFGSEPYVIRRTWDYFVRHLLGTDPPPGYRIRGPSP